MKGKKKKWKVTFHWVSYQTGTAEVVADTEEQAREKADEICAGDIDNWVPYDGDLSVQQVEEIK